MLEFRETFRLVYRCVVGRLLLGAGWLLIGFTWHGMAGKSAGELIISQYVETNSSRTPKGIELWNPTSGSIDFAVTELVILKGLNGDPLVQDFSLNVGVLQGA